MFNLRLEVAKQLNFIISSCRLYDEGRYEEALRIAVATRVLFHNTRYSRAIVDGYIKNNDIKLVSTTMYARGNKNGHFMGFIGMLPSMSGFRPYLNDSQRKEEIPWQKWWELEPILELYGSGEVITRKEIVLACVNKDGGAHVDETKPEEYERLEDGIGLSVEALFKDGIKRIVKLKYANLAIMRQIGHEILISPCMQKLAEVKQSVSPNDPPRSASDHR